MEIGTKCCGSSQEGMITFAFGNWWRFLEKVKSGLDFEVDVYRWRREEM